MDDSLLTIEVAGIRVGIRPLSEGFDAFFRNYLVDAEADFVLGATEEALTREQHRIADYDGGAEHSRFELERLWLYRQIAEALPAYDAFLIHATAVRLDGNAYLFLGPSGTGKTTHLRLWKERFGDRLRTINDDKPLIRATGSQIMVCGSPWSGKEKWHNNISAPLKAALFLHQSDCNSVRPMERSDAWECLMGQLYRSADPVNSRRTLAFADRLIRSTPLYYLECNKEEEAVQVAYDAVRAQEPKST